jgi:hypothetical protein
MSEEEKENQAQDKKLSEDVTRVTGQGFLLLKQKDFLIKLKAITTHITQYHHPISQVISNFTHEFIERNRLLLYEIDYNPSDDYMDA